MTNPKPRSRPLAEAFIGNHAPLVPHLATGQAACAVAAYAAGQPTASRVAATFAQSDTGSRQLAAMLTQVNIGIAAAAARPLVADMFERMQPIVAAYTRERGPNLAALIEATRPKTTTPGTYSTRSTSAAGRHPPRPPSGAPTSIRRPPCWTPSNPSP